MTINDMEKAFLEYKNTTFSDDKWRMATASLKPLAYAARAEQDRVIREGNNWNNLARAAGLNSEIRKEARKLAEIAGRALGRHVSITELFDFV